MFLNAGERKNISIEWFQGGGGYEAKLFWEFKGVPSIIPNCRLFPTSVVATDCNFAISASANPSSVGCGGTSTLSASCSGSGCSGVSYTWVGNEDSYNGTPITVILPNANGAVGYTLTASKGGCANKTVVTTVTVGGCNNGGGGSCNYTEGQFLYNWYGENIYAHKCGSKYYITTDGGSGGYFKPRHWLEATNYAQASCFEEDDPRPSGCNGGGCTSPTPTLSASSSTVPSTLSASGCSGTVNWSNGGTGNSISVNTAGTYTATCTNSGCSTSGNGSVTVTGSGGGCSFTDGQYLLDYNGETIQAKFCNGVLYARATWGAWKHPNWLIGAGMNSTTAACFATYNPGCGALRISAEQLSEETDDNIAVYPNPTTGKIKVSFTMQKDENVWFNLYDAQGKSLQLSDFEGKKGRNEVEFDLQNYISGAYFIDLQYNQKREVRKVMKVN